MKTKHLIILSLLVIISSSVSAYRWEQRIPIQNSLLSTTSLTYVPDMNSTTVVGMIEWNMSGYDFVSEIYYETLAIHIFTGDPNGVGGGTMQLFDVTNNTKISSSAFSMLGGAISYRRSINLTYLFNNTNINLSIQIKALTGSTAYLYASNLVIVQDGNITKTRTFIPVGASAQEGDSCGTPEDEILEPKQWNWTTSQFPTNINVSYSTTLRSDTASLTARSILRNSTANFATLSSSNTSFNYLRSAVITMPNNAPNMSIGICRFLGTVNAVIRNAFIVVDQYNINPANPKTVLINQITSIDWTTSVDSPDFNPANRQFFNASNFKGVNLNGRGVFTTYQTSKGIVNGTVFNSILLGGELLNGNQTKGNTSIQSQNLTNLESNITGEFYFIHSGKLDHAMWDNNTGGFAEASSARLVFYVNGLRCWNYDENKRELYIPSNCTAYIKNGDEVWI